MRTYVHIIPVSDLDTLVMDGLAALYPEGHRVTPTTSFRSWSLKRPLADSTTQRCLHLIQSVGIAPYCGGPKAPNSISIDLTHKYTRADRAKAELLELANVPDADGVRLEDGIVRKFKVKTAKDIAFVCSAHIVSDRARAILEAAGLRGLAFKPVIPYSKRQSADTTWGSLPPWWELTSDIILPPTLIPMVDRDQQPVTAHPRRGWFREGIYDFSEPDSSPVGQWLKDAHFAYAQLRYRRADLSGMPPFDYALTNEYIDDSPTWGFRIPVVSQRFYQVCREHGFRCGFDPVAIDD